MEKPEIAWDHDVSWFNERLPIAISITFSACIRYSTTLR